MPTGYVRQSAAAIVTGATIQAAHFNNEYNALQSFADASSGHNHDGTVGGGAKITAAGIGALTNTSSGFLAADGANGLNARTLTAPAAGFTITNPAGVAGNPTFVLANDLAAVEGLSTAGLAVRTGSDTWAIRTLVNGTGITITNPAGTAGDITVGISASYAGQSSITTVGTITSGTWSGSFGAVSGANLTNLTAANISAGTAGISVSGNAATATALQTARNINGTSFNGTADITVTAAAGTLTGATLNASVTASSLTSVGTITSGTWQGTVIGSNFGGAGAVNGLLKANGSGVVSAAAAGTDYANSGQKLSYFAATTSAELAGVISDETGSGALVFGTGPTISLASASTAVTQTAGDNSTKIATTAYVDTAVASGGTAFTNVVQQVFTSSGTYTPTSGMKFCIIEVRGAGGGSGGTDAPAGAASGGGGEGGYAKKRVTAATIGASQSVTVGAGGTAGAADSGSGSTAGGTGGTTSVGAIVSATGGAGGSQGTLASTSKLGGAGGTGSSGDINITGQAGGNSVSTGAGASASGGIGGGEGGGRGGIAAQGTVGSNGGGAGGTGSNGVTLAGRAGGGGYVIITEFI